MWESKNPRGAKSCPRFAIGSNARVFPSPLNPSEEQVESCASFRRVCSRPSSPNEFVGAA